MNLEQKAVSPWQQINATLVINLDNRPERWEQLRQSAKEIIPDDKLIRFPASLGVKLKGYGLAPWFRGKSSDTRWAARAGCTLSHQRTNVFASEKDWNMTLILEDDADFSKTNKNELDMILGELLSSRFSWDVCYLGFSKTRGPSRLIAKIGNHEVYEVSGCSAAHAYLVNAKARDWIMKNLPSEDNIWPWISLHRISDRWYSWNMSLNLKVIAVSPSLVIQREGYSDLVQNITDYNTEFPGKIIQASTNELGFRLNRICWRFHRSITLAHDLIRCLLKRINGF